MTLQPLQDRIIVRPSPPAETTKGGLIIPDNAQEKPVTGTVLAIGPGRTSESGVAMPGHVLVGDTVLYGVFSGTKFELNGEELLMMRESDVFAREIADTLATEGGLSNVS